MQHLVRLSGPTRCLTAWTPHWTASSLPRLRRAHSASGFPNERHATEDGRNVYPAMADTTSNCRLPHFPRFFSCFQPSGSTPSNGQVNRETKYRIVPVGSHQLRGASITITRPTDDHNQAILLYRYQEAIPGYPCGGVGLSSSLASFWEQHTLPETSPIFSEANHTMHEQAFEYSYHRQLRYTCGAPKATAHL